VQLVQLQEQKARLEALGYGVAALSYDSPEIQQEFARRKGLTYTLIADPESRWLASVGLLNTEATGLTKGTSLPATLVVRPDGTLSHIFRESAYQDRLTPASLVGILQGGTAPQAQQAPLPQKPQVASSQSDSKVTSGSLFSMTVELALPKGYHAYAPGSPEGIPLALTFEPNPYFEIVSVEFPKPAIENILDEDVPIYQGRTAITVRAKVRSDKQTREKLSELGKTVLKASFAYQCCTDTACLAPATAALAWEFEYQPLDLQRSPDSIQHHE
jgi:hypothetical protein